MKKIDLLRLPATIFIFFRFDKLMRLINKRKITILMYHGVTEIQFEGAQNYDYKHIQVAKFKKQLQYLTKHFNIISLEDFINSKKLPDNPLILTFDDGYQNNFMCLFPILKENNISATIFLTSDIIGTKKINWPDIIEFAINNTRLIEINILKKDFDITHNQNKINTIISIKKLLRRKEKQQRERITKELLKKLKIKFNKIPSDYQILNLEEIKEMISNNISFGSHTKTHAILTRLSLDELKDELINSKKQIEKKLNIKINAISYPNGYYNQQIMELAKESGYAYGLTTEYGLNKKNSPKLKLKRIGINGSFSHEFFIANLYFNFNKLNSFFCKVYMFAKNLLKFN